MTNKQDIADRYAAKNGFDVASLVATKDGWAYYRLGWNNRPRYTGHPCVIKISHTGNVLAVTDIEERYWAVGRAKAPSQ